MRNLLLVILTLISISCVAEDDGRLSVAAAQEPPVQDVMVNTSLSGRNILAGNVYERLLSYGDDGVEPLLAESCSLSGDGHTLTLTLREGVVFHDGSALDIRDVVESLNRWIKVYPAAEKMTGGALFEERDGMAVITAETSLALLPLMIASSPQCAIIVPSESLENLTDGGLLFGAPGTGPYRVDEWSEGEKVSLSLFDDYWGEKPEIEGIDYYFVPDPVTRRLGLESGQYDFIDTVLSDDVPSLSENEDIKLLQGSENGSIAVVFNKKEGVFRDIEMREAAALSADRDALMRACYGESGYSVHTDYMEAPWSVDSSLDPFGKEDRERAKAILDETGYDGEEIRILTSNLTDLDKIAVALASQLESAGMNVSITVLDWASFLEKRRDESSWDIYVSAMSRVMLPADKAYLSPSAPGGFSDSVSLEMLSELNEASDEEEAMEIWRETQIRLWEYIPVIIPGHYSTVYASTADLEGVDLSDGYHFRSAHLSRQGVI